MTSYIIRNVAPDLWVRVKAQADQEGRTLRGVLLRLLVLYADRGLEALERRR